MVLLRLNVHYLRTLLWYTKFSHTTLSSEPQLVSPETKCIYLDTYGQSTLVNVPFRIMPAIPETSLFPFSFLYTLLKLSLYSIASECPGYAQSLSFHIRLNDLDTLASPYDLHYRFANNHLFQCFLP